jgi:hypothetical protein
MEMTVELNAYSVMQIFLEPNNTTGIGETNISVPIFQAYPQPFNNSFTAVYKLENSGDYELSLYDILGRRITIIETGTKPAGTYSCKWNQKGLSDGIYILHFNLNGKPAETIKLIKVSF